MRRGADGFTLVEALVALVVAGVMLPVLARALAGAWRADRAPMEILSAVTVARDALAGDEAAVGQGRERGFTAARVVEALRIDVLPSEVAPAPAASGRKKKEEGDTAPDATPAAIKLVMPERLGTPGPGGGGSDAGPVALRRISVVVSTPSGRRVSLDAVRLEGGTP